MLRELFIISQLNCLEIKLNCLEKGHVYLPVCVLLSGWINCPAFDQRSPPPPSWTTPPRPKLATALISVKVANFPPKTNSPVIKVVKKYQIIQNVEIYSLSNLRPHPVWTGGGEAHMRNEWKEDIVEMFLCETAQHSVTNIFRIWT